MQRKIKHFLSGIAILLLIVTGTNIAKAQNAFAFIFYEFLLLIV
jgi:hypothetical protein